MNTSSNLDHFLRDLRTINAKSVPSAIKQQMTMLRLQIFEASQCGDKATVAQASDAYRQLEREWETPPTFLDDDAFWLSVARSIEYEYPTKSE